MEKSPVAPLKITTMQRLELTAVSAIRTTNNLKTVLNDFKGRLDTSSLRTFLYEVMAIIKSRPLTYHRLNDPVNLEPLTPFASNEEKKITSSPSRKIRARKSLRSETMETSSVSGKTVLE